MIDPSTRVEMSSTGVPWIVDLHGQRIAPAIVSGADDSTDDLDDDGDDGGGSGETGETYTKQQLDSILGRKTKQAIRDHERKLAESLGMDPAEAAKLLKAKAEQDAGTMSEAERMLAEAKAQRAEAEKIAADARRAKVDAKAEARLIRAGLDDDAVSFVLPGLNLDDDADDDDIAAAIDAARAKVPLLFGTTGTDPKDRKPPSSSSGTRDRRRNPPPASSVDVGKERAARYLESGQIR